MKTHFCIQVGEVTAGLGTESWTSRRMERGEGNKLGKVFCACLFVCLSAGLSVILLFEVKAVLSSALGCSILCSTQKQ